MLEVRLERESGRERMRLTCRRLEAVCMNLISHQLLSLCMDPIQPKVINQSGRISFVKFWVREPPTRP